jgi:hypothetical protein
VSQPPAQAESEGEAAEASAWERRTAALILVVPLLGIAVHAIFFVYGRANPEWLYHYVFVGPWLMYVVAPLSFANLVASWMHYRRTGMRMDLAARIATYLWILSYVLLLLHCRKAV